MDSVFDDKTISLKLSEALREIGVNERIVKVRRKLILLQEHFSNITGIFIEDDKYLEAYHFGSQSEGSTTPGLHSDLDTLICLPGFRAIQDLGEWKPGVINLLMVRDGTSPGYCLLQVVQTDTSIPLLETQVLHREYLRDDKGRILFKNTVENITTLYEGVTQNGPASTIEGRPGRDDIDIVPALHCDSWPEEGRGWLDRQCIGNWPSEDVKRMAMSKGCFLVPVGSKCNNLDEVEWRISTSIAERLMMFNLNITQLMCYVMMKLISKTFFTMNKKSTISSFMCKCIVFYCIENTPVSFWCEDNLFACLMKCISNLHDDVQRLNCPHYIIPSNNLMANRINPEQQRYLLNELNRLLCYNTNMLFAIKIDNLGTRLQIKLTDVLPSPINLLSQIDDELKTVFCANFNKVQKVCLYSMMILRELSGKGLLAAAALVEGIRKLQCQYHTLCDTAVEACRYFITMLCSLVGSIQASSTVYTSNTVSPDAIRWLTAGFESDVWSSRLKLASAFYCAGDINNAELTLREIEKNYTDVVVPVCGCYLFAEKPESAEQMMHVYSNHEVPNKIFAFCVKFIRCEASIIPQELRHELFRSTEVEHQNRSLRDIYWMDFAVVDSRPYLYFLQYKVYKHQGRVQQRRKALSNLLKTNLNERKLRHGETAWNLLGQCMEQENMIVQADWCYQRSLALLPHNNAANFHMTRLRRSISRGCQWLQTALILSEITL